MQAIALVFLGAGLGGVGRHLAGLAAARAFGAAFPWGTLLVNVSGSLLMGLLVGWLALRPDGASQNLRLFLATGALGGYTTFSTFSLEAVMLWQRGEPLAAAAYVLASILSGVAGLAVGLAAMRSLA
ncbi:fluoride efflux transporter CrcB [Camelimonas abortus]|uniref:Fluoride-specific ion channel FluC n=1 Tax=Camelimonas abortus TaxID=1017184 RepID=A0ABV7LEY2_9HYPH